MNLVWSQVFLLVLLVNSLWVNRLGARYNALIAASYLIGLLMSIGVTFNLDYPRQAALVNTVYLLLPTVFWLGALYYCRWRSRQSR